MRNLVTLGALGLAAALFVVGRPASAQRVHQEQISQCNAGCMCGGTSCTCSNESGSGSKSVCPGDGSCTVFKCSGASLANAGVTVIGQVTGKVGGAARWVVQGDGVALKRACSGVVIDEYADKRAAAELRHASSNIDI